MEAEEEDGSLGGVCLYAGGCGYVYSLYKMQIRYTEKGTEMKTSFQTLVSLIVQSSAIFLITLCLK